MIYPRIKELFGFSRDDPDEEVLIAAKAVLFRVCKPCWELKYCPYGAFVACMHAFEISNGSFLKEFS